MVNFGKYVAKILISQFSFFAKNGLVKSNPWPIAEMRPA